MSVLKKQELEKELCDALGLKNVQKLDLHFAVDSFATAEVKMTLDEDQLKSFVSVVKKYNLKVDEATSQEQVSLPSTDFGDDAIKYAYHSNWGSVLVKNMPLQGHVEDWSLNVDKFQIDKLICEEVNIPNECPRCGGGLLNTWLEGLCCVSCDWYYGGLKTVPAINPCIDCNLFFPHMDNEPVTVCLQKMKSGELPTCKENCTKYLANNGTCPHYPTVGLEGIE